MNIKSLAAFGSTLALCAGIALAAAPATSAENCRPPAFGSTDIWGNKRYNCSDGSYTLKRSPFNDRWDDPWSTYELRPNSGWGRPSQKCRYNSFFDRYDCR